MSFQAYLDTIKEKTGLTPKDFKVIAREKGLLQGDTVKPGPIVAWLKAEYGLGHGHAMAIVHTFKAEVEPQRTMDEQIVAHFKGEKAKWQEPYNELLAKVGEFGPDISEGPTGTYISILRKGKKFAIVQITADRFDVGFKLKGVEPTGRLEDSGPKDRLVSHRVHIYDPDEIDGEVIDWLRQAYDRA
jgi:hypothetical protein